VAAAAVLEFLIAEVAELAGHHNQDCFCLPMDAAIEVYGPASGLVLWCALAESLKLKVVDQSWKLSGNGNGGGASERFVAQVDVLGAMLNDEDLKALVPEGDAPPANPGLTHKKSKADSGSDDDGSDDEPGSRNTEIKNACERRARADVGYPAVVAALFEGLPFDKIMGEPDDKLIEAIKETTNDPMMMMMSLGKNDDSVDELQAFRLASAQLVETYGSEAMKESIHGLAGKIALSPNMKAGVLLAAVGDARALEVLRSVGGAGWTGGGTNNEERLAYADALARCRDVDGATAAFMQYWHPDSKGGKEADKAAAEVKVDPERKKKELTEKQKAILAKLKKK